jgi:hypothetical protein
MHQHQHHRRRRHARARYHTARSPSPTPHPTYNGVASMTGEEALGSAYDALLHAASVRVKAAFIAVGTRGPTT